ncbi:MAG: thioredoxin domain-containing protein [Candidatus Acidiferrales bacterium]
MIANRPCVRTLSFAALLLLSLTAADRLCAQAAPPMANLPAQAVAPEHAALLKRTESFVRNLFAWGPAFKVDLGPLTPSPSPDFYTVPIRVTVNGQSDAGTFYVSKDGKTFVRGELFDTTKDPFAENRAKLHVDGSPTKGPADAPVTIYEFSDFECPHCRALNDILKQVEAENPKIRVVFKNFPLTQIHPWAETAAIGAHCAYIQKPDAFWTMHDLIFDNQDVISAENVWDKLVSFAAQANLDENSFKACLSSPEAKQAIVADHALGESLGVTSTPTLYINGRPLIGGDKPTLEQYIAFHPSI